MQYNQRIANWKGLSRLGIVLQESVLQHKDIGFSCIAIQWDGRLGKCIAIGLLAAGGIVSQYTKCIVTEAARL